MYYKEHQYSVVGVRQIFFYAVIVFSVFQNSMLAEYFSYLGYSISVFFLFPLIVLSLFYRGGYFPVDRFFLLCFVVFFLVTVIGYVLYDGEAYGENLRSKSVRLLILNLIFIAPIFIRVRFSEVMVFYALSIAVLISLFGYVFYDLFNFELFRSFVVFRESHDGRPRSFSLESSYFGNTVAIILLILLSYFRNYRFSSALIFICGVLLVLSTSKGSLFTFLVSAVSAYLIFEKKGLKIFFIMILIVLTSLFFMDYDFYGGTTFSTRFSVWLLSVLSLIQMPFGVSYAGYLEQFYKLVPEVGAIVSTIPILGDEEYMREFWSYYAAQSSHAIGTKSYIMDNVLSYGLPFLFFILYVFFKLLRKVYDLKNYWSFVLVIYLAISLLVFIHGVGFYIYSVAFILIRNMEVASESSKN